MRQKQIFDDAYLTIDGATLGELNAFALPVRLATATRARVEVKNFIVFLMNGYWVY